MVLTINIATAVNREEQVAGYAYYVLNDQRNYKKADYFKKEIINNKVRANVMSIANLFYKLWKSKIEGVQYIIINIDCPETIAILKDGKKYQDVETTKAAAFAQQVILKLREKYHILPRRLRNTPFIAWRKPEKDNKADAWCNNMAVKMMYQALDAKHKPSEFAPLIKRFDKTMALQEVIADIY